MLKTFSRIAGSSLDKLRTTVRRKSLSVAHQMSALECGAACLSMILTYHGRKTSVADCRNDLDVGRDGLTALSIVRAARSRGLRVSAYSVNPNDLQFVQGP